MHICLITCHGRRHIHVRSNQHCITTEHHTHDASHGFGAAVIARPSRVRTDALIHRRPPKVAAGCLSDADAGTKNCSAVRRHPSIPGNGHSGADGNIYYHDDVERYEDFNNRWDKDYEWVNQHLRNCQMAAPTSAELNRQHRSEWQTRDRLRVHTTMRRRPAKRRSRRGLNSRQRNKQRYHARRAAARTSTDAAAHAPTTSPEQRFELPELYPVNTDDWD
jgi:hypothetical protein